MDNNDSAVNADALGLAALVPWRLTSGLKGDFSPDLWPCISLSKRWQCRATLAQIWELASPEKGRLYELAGYMAGAGEQLGLACTVDHEFSLWSAADLSSAQHHERVQAEMVQRALAEFEGYYVIGIGHALANLIGRVLALDPSLQPHLENAKGIRTSFPPLSEKKQDWVSMNSDTARALRKVAAKSGMSSFPGLADPVVKLAGSKEWRELDSVRGEHFHRWRSQSAGMTGAPKTSPWRPSRATRTATP